MSQTHKRSKSFPEKKGAEVRVSTEASERIKLDIGILKDSITGKDKQPPRSSEVHNSLKQEILQLESKLQYQFKLRHALEKAMGYRTSSNDVVNEQSMPKPATELIMEISLLELEVKHLEQYLLSLYRRAFEPQISSVSPKPKNERLKSPVTTPRARRLDFSRIDISTKSDQPKGTGCAKREEYQMDSAVERCRSELDARTASEEPLDSALRVCQSQPLSMTQYAENGGGIISLAEHLGTRISDHVVDTPNKIAEEMIKCMSAIFCKLADPPEENHGLSSPSSSLSSAGAFSPHNQYETWNPGLGNNSAFDVRLDNPFHIQGLKEFSGPYSTMVEVSCIYKDARRAAKVEDLLQNFRSLISRLEDIDPRKLKHEEKLAFWINIHNALVMHAFLAYGIPQNNVKRLFLLLKAAYNVGSHTVSADTIQSSILGCRMSRPGQWLRVLFASRKFKPGDERIAYAIEHPEPLLHFALCSGSHSDPAVRVYTPKRVYQELESAKEEYIRATFGVRRDGKIHLAKLVESFVKDSGLCSVGLLEMVQKCLPESSRKSLKRCQAAKPLRKSIEWVSHNFSFRYLISKELIR